MSKIDCSILQLKSFLPCSKSLQSKPFLPCSILKITHIFFFIMHSFFHGLSYISSFIFITLSSFHAFIFNQLSCMFWLLIDLMNLFMLLKSSLTTILSAYDLHLTSLQVHSFVWSKYLIQVFAHKKVYHAQ